MTNPEFERFEQALPALIQASGWKGNTQNPEDATTPSLEATFETLMEQPVSASPRPLWTRWSGPVAALFIVEIGRAHV